MAVLIFNDTTDQPVGGVLSLMTSDCILYLLGLLGTPSEQVLKKYLVPGTIT